METVAHELLLILRSVKGLHEAAVAAAGVRVELPALAVLTTLADVAPMRPSTLAEALHLDLSSVSRQVAACEREGWVSRQRDPGDSRAALLELTPAGRHVLLRVRSGRVALLTTLLPSWSDDDLAGFAEQLHRFRSDLTRDRVLDLTGPAAPTPALAGEHR